MIFRRRKSQPDNPDTADGAVKPGIGDAAVDATSDAKSTSSAGMEPRGNGPWDRAETTRDEDEPGYVDLGGMVVQGAEGLELRLQVDESSQQVASVLLAGSQSGLELRAFAAPRHDGIWDEVRADIATEAQGRDGTVEEVDGDHGVALRVVVPVLTKDGKQGKQASRIVGVDGPRWMLRGTFLGKAATAAGADETLEAAFRAVIVVRGDGPMAPRSMIPLAIPTALVEAAEQAAADGDGVPADPEASDAPAGSDADR